jgi:hypothetical protein
LQALKGQQDRDDKIKTLLLTIVDVLGFVEEVDALSKIRKLEDTVSSMMKQIYECALFIQTYGEKGLASTYPSLSIFWIDGTFDDRLFSAGST